MNSYPPLRLGLITAILKLKEDYTRDESVFSVSECPYDTEMVGILQKLFKVIEVEKIVTKHIEIPVAADKPGKGRPKKGGPLSADNELIVENEVSEILNDLKALKPADGKRMDAATEIQIIKTKAVLIEKLLGMSERAYTVKKTSGFMAVVIEILDDCVSEDMRDIFLRKIAPYRS